jgi:N-acetyl-beta-hexosaminidase/uncharacterized protein YbbC (DUF1343 family)
MTQLIRCFHLIFFLCLFLYSCLGFCAATSIVPGATQLNMYLPMLENKRVALLANQSSRIGQAHLLDVLLKHHIHVVKVFAVEHGFRGVEDDKVPNTIDLKTGIPIISLYGKKLKPSAEDLSDIDVIVFDIQDVGVRFYTYISSLQKLMEVAVEYNKPLIILDRPNPNGFYVDGPTLDMKYKSFTGMQPIPLVYGMTMGEYALMLKGENWLELMPRSKASNLHLTIIPCLHYTHSSLYVPPIKPSPNLTSIQSIYWYPSIGLMEGTALSVGRGTSKPFQQFGHPLLATDFTFIPKAENAPAIPPYVNQVCHGWTLAATKKTTLKEIDNQLQIKYLIKAYNFFPDKAHFFKGFEYAAGNDVLRQQIQSGVDEVDIRKSWQLQLDAFMAIRKKYLLYRDFPPKHPLQAFFELEKNNADDTFTGSIVLKNNTAKPIEHWQLAFNFSRAFTRIDEGVVRLQVGDFLVLAPNQANPQVIPAYSAFTFHFVGKRSIEHFNQAPRGYFLLINHPGSAQAILPVEAAPVRLSFTPTTKLNPENPEKTLAQLPIIPLPVYLEHSVGQFRLTPTTVIQADPIAIQSAQFFINTIQPATSYHLKLNTKHAQNNVIIFSHSNADKTLGREGYTLQVTSNKIIIRAIDAAGFFYAVQSLRQLLPPQIFADKKITTIPWVVPAVIIRDMPRFSYRGFHLDVARHFFPKEQILRLIDLMALHKLNQFHWHLSDDQGWRIAIKRYPTLTTAGAWRGYGRVLPPALGSGAKRYGGYYSQKEIRDIIAYANQRHINIIPEIDVPGHSRALIKSLPKELTDSEDKSIYGSMHDYHDNVLSPCLESTYQVLDNIYSEIAAIFPSKIIHVGGDEVPEGVWKQSPRCVTLMHSLGLNNSQELQHYFLQRIQKMLAAKNKNMAGWEEIAQDPHLFSSTVIYNWKEEKDSLKAAASYPTVMMPADYFYFDQAYNDNPAELGASWAGPVSTFKTYSWKASSANTIQGVEGALWSESVDSKARLDYMVFPRLLALAEVAWTPQALRDWKNFSERASLHLLRLDYLGVQYRHDKL